MKRTPALGILRNNRCPLHTNNPVRPAISRGRFIHYRRFRDGRIHAAWCPVLQRDSSWDRASMTSVGPRNGALRSTHELGSIRSESQDPETAAPPPIGNLAVVFTDIVQSTALWEAHPRAMRDSLKLHDDLLRKAIRAYRGYEVKSTGDGFMIAFPTTTSALSWCLAVQKHLLDEPWPPAILETVQGKELRDSNDNIVFRGLSVRTSIHWGAPVCSLNEVAGRMDYHGPVVTRAARAIERTDGGQITVSGHFLVELAKTLTGEWRESELGVLEGDVLAHGNKQERPTDLKGIVARVLHSNDDQDATSAMERLDGEKDLEIRHLGEFDLKGLSDSLQLFLILPAELKGRLEHYHNQLSYISSWEGLEVT